jgi:hypothetical protein
MKLVYIVIRSHYDDDTYDIEAVFSMEQLAIDYKGLNIMLSVHAFELDPEI